MKEREISLLFKPLLFGIFIYNPTLLLPRRGKWNGVTHGPVQGQMMSQGRARAQLRHLPCLVVRLGPAPLMSAPVGHRTFFAKRHPGQPAASFSPTVIPRSLEAALCGGTGGLGSARASTRARARPFPSLGRVCVSSALALPSTSVFPSLPQDPGFLGSDLPLNLKTRGPQESSDPNPVPPLAPLAHGHSGPAETPQVTERTLLSQHPSSALPC